MQQVVTPRQIALAALQHQVPEVVPAYVRIVLEWERHAAHFGVGTWDELADRLGNTILSFSPAHCAFAGDFIPTSLPPIWGVPEDHTRTYTDTVPRPLAGADTVADVEAYAWPSVEDFDFAGMRSRLLAEQTRLRLAPSWMPVFSRLCELFGMEQAMVNLYWNRPVIEATLARLEEFYTEFYERMLAVCGDQLDVFGIGDDFAGNDGLLLSPDLWRSLFKPLYARWLRMGKAKGLLTLMHCCGNITEVLPDLIDSGLDAWQTVQTHLPGQEPERIKARFGRHLAFVGAIDTTNVVGVATPAQVKEHVRRQILALGEGGGYICAPDHTILEGVPSENVAALYEAVAEFRMPGYTVR